MTRPRKQKNVPAFHELMIPIVKALIALGGSGTIEEINEKVYQIKNLSEETLQIPHAESDSRSAVDYRLAWARTYLKQYGIVENSSRGIWTLVKSDIHADELKPAEIVKVVRSRAIQKPAELEKISKLNEIEISEPIEIVSWKSQLLGHILSIKSDAFERLVQRLLRENGFIEVEVTGRSGDGGIDGKGIVRISGFLSFHVIFQCKRYKGSITPSQIRDFRGAMQGRADKGLFVTTGTFTREARKEATRDGAPPIDLIDGELLCEKLKEFSLGVETRMIEEVEIRNDWFAKL